MVDVQEVAGRFSLEVLGVRSGASITANGLADKRTRAGELADERDLVYIELEVGYDGPETAIASWQRLRMEDSEGYLLAPLASNDALEDELEAGEVTFGGVLFSLYRDLRPRRLWFDTGVTYTHGKEPVLIEIALPVDDEESVPLARQEARARRYESEQARRVEAAPQATTHRLLADLSRELGRPYRKLRNGYAFRLSVGDGRRQVVLVNFAGIDERGRDLITFVTLCTPAGAPGANDRLLLTINAKLSYGAAAVLTLGGAPYYGLIDTQLASTADLAELETAVAYLAWRGDELEAKLTGGHDLR